MYSAPLLLALVVYTASGLIALYGMMLARQHVKAPRSRWLVPLMAVSAAWMFINALMHVRLPFEVRLVIGHFASIGVFVGALWFFFALEYCVPGYRASRTVQTVILGWCCVLLASAFANPLHHMFWPSINLDHTTGIIVFEHGPLYMVTVLSGLMAFTPGTLLFIMSAYRSTGLYRAQSVALAVAMLVQVLTYVVFMSLSRWPLGVYPAMSTGFAAGIVAFAIERLQFLGAIPVGRTQLIDSMPDGFLVLDIAERIADSNRAARELLCEHDSLDFHGRQFAEVVSHWPAAAPLLAEAAGDGGVSVSITTPAGRRVHVRRWPLHDAGSGFIGSAVVLRDITASERTRVRLEEATTSVASWVEEMNAVEAFVSRSRRRR